MEFIEKSIDYYKLNIKYAFLNVFSNIKGNLCLFIVILIFQYILSVITLSYYDNKNKSFAAANENYDWHIVALRCPRAAASLIISSEFDYNYNYDVGYEVVRVDPVKVSDEINTTCYDIYIKLTGGEYLFSTRSLLQSYDTFVQNMVYLNLNIDKSPLYYIEAKYTFSDFWYYIMEDADFVYLCARQNTTEPTVRNFLGEDVPFRVKTFMGLGSDVVDADSAVFISLLITWVLLAMVIFSRILKSKIDLDKYTYGIYKVFGADVKKQRCILKFELIGMGLITIIPAYLAGAVSYVIIYSSISLGFADIVKAFFFTAAVSLLLMSIVIIHPSKVIVKETCVNLIKSSDTAGYISSPRKSYLIPKQNYAVVQALLNVWRLRKYYVTLLISVTMILSLFICCISLGDSYKYDAEKEKSQWTLIIKNDIDQTELDTRIIPDIAVIEGVSKVTGEIKLYENPETQIEIYTNKDATVKDCESVSKKIREWCSLSKYDYKYLNHHTSWNNYMIKTAQYDKLYRNVGFMILLLLPVVCIYTQYNLYYKKRKEYQIYSMLGVESKTINKYLWFDGIILLILSIPFSIISTLIYFNVLGLIVQITEINFSLHIVNYLSVIIGGIILSGLIVISPYAAYRFQAIFSVIKKRKKKVLTNDHT